MFKSFGALSLAMISVLAPKFAMRQTGTEIFSMQNRLFNLGYYSKKVTGMYGTITETSYKKFQQLNGFTENGIITDNELNHLYSMSVVTKLDSKRIIPKSSNLSYESFQYIDTVVTQNFEILFVTKNNKTATYKVNSSQGFLLGSLDGIDMKDLNVHLRYPVIATIQNVRYPASLDYNGTSVNLHFKDSKTFLGFADSEHQNNINKLLGL